MGMERENEEMNGCVLTIATPISEHRPLSSRLLPAASCLVSWLPSHPLQSVCPPTAPHTPLKWKFHEA